MVVQGAQIQSEVTVAVCVSVKHSPRHIHISCSCNSLLLNIRHCNHNPRSAMSLRAADALLSLACALAPPLVATRLRQYHRVLELSDLYGRFFAGESDKPCAWRSVPSSREPWQGLGC